MKIKKKKKMIKVKLFWKSGFGESKILTLSEFQKLFNNGEGFSLESKLEADTIEFIVE